MMKDYDPDLLISLYFNGNGLMTMEDFENLSDWIKLDETNARKFVRAGFTHQFVHDSLTGNDIQKNVTRQLDDSGGFCEDLWRELIVQEETAPEVEIERQQEEVVENIVYVSRKPRKKSKWSIFVAIASTAAMIIVMANAYFNPSVGREEVAEIVDSMNAEWSEESLSAMRGTRLYNNSGPLHLGKGFAKIKFDYGAEVVIEGPSEINIISPGQMILSYGRVSADVPERATGFTIETPYSSIVDLGTEFGVKVDVDGSTDIHMFEGKASLVPGKKGRTGKGKVLAAGQAIRVKTSGVLKTIAFEAGAFVKKINSKTNTVWRGRSINLADIIGGGNGFGTARDDIALNPLTGKTVNATLGSSVAVEETDVEGGIFTEVLQSKWIDGVFVPDGGDGSVQVAHNGLSFDGFGDTSGTMYAYLQNRKDSVEVVREYENPEMQDKACIYMHTNLGVTFDLDKIRDRFDWQVEIKAFRAQSGFRLMKRDIKAGNYTETSNKADFWVLVDGQVRYNRLEAVATSWLDDVEVPITQDDRYLTLATTESDDGTGSDWTIFVEPVLILE